MAIIAMTREMATLGRDVAAAWPNDWGWILFTMNSSRRISRSVRACGERGPALSRR